MNRLGRPRKRVNPEQVEAFASAGCTNEEIGALLGVSDDLLVRRFADHIKKGRAFGKGRLRSKQYAEAMNGNVTMLIWLGKQMLGQTDRSDVTIHDTERAREVAERIAAAIEAAGAGRAGETVSGDTD